MAVMIPAASACKGTDRDKKERTVYATSGTPISAAAIAPFADIICARRDRDRAEMRGSRQKQIKRASEIIKMREVYI